MSNQPQISAAFEAFRTEAPDHAAAWMRLVQDLGAASALDDKTLQLAYLAVLAALQRTNGVPFHVASAVRAGASREEVISAILVGLPAAGHGVTEVLPEAVEALNAMPDGSSNP